MQHARAATMQLLRGLQRLRLCIMKGASSGQADMLGGTASSRARYRPYAGNEQHDITHQPTHPTPSVVGGNLAIVPWWQAYQITATAQMDNALARGQLEEISGICL